MASTHHTYSAAPHIRTPRWLTGRAWQAGPRWQDASADGDGGGLSVLRLDEDAETGTKLGASLRVRVAAEGFSRRARGAHRYLVAQRAEDSEMGADDILYSGDVEAAARAAVTQGLLRWAKLRCAHCRALPRGQWCATHVRSWGRVTTCPTCTCDVLDCRDSHGHVWCDACGDVFLPTTRVREAAADSSLWDGAIGPRRAIRLLSGSVLYGQASLGRGTRIRLARLRAGARMRYVAGDTLVALVEV